MDRYLEVAMSFAGFLTFSYPIIIWVTMPNCCRRVSYFWHQFFGAKEKCIDVKSFLLAVAVLNMVNDMVVLIIPFPRIVKLQMTRRKKFAICGIMAVGVM